MLKSGKSDVSQIFNSDCLKNAPDELTVILTKLFKSFLIHGYIPENLLVCFLDPLVKDESAKLDKSSNYRAIAISSLILKVFDLCLLIILHDKLQVDELQFGYQRGNSTTMCSWVVREVIDHFVRNNTPVYSAVLGASKAFDKIAFSKLFELLIQRGISWIYLRCMPYIYQKQL